MVGRHGTDLRRELGTAIGRELVGVELRNQPQLPGHRKDRPGLVVGDGARLDEGIAEGRQPLVRDRRQHLFTDEPDVLGAPLRELGRDRVGAEKGGDQADRLTGGQGAVGAEGLELVREGEAVAALRLNGRDAERHDVLQDLRGTVRELGLARGPGLGHCRGDPAPRLRDLEVALPPEPALEVLRPPPAEGEVGVAVDQPRDHDPSFGVLLLPLLELGRKVLPRPHPPHDFALPRQRGIGDMADVTLPGAGAGVEAGDVGEDGHGWVTSYR